MKTDTEISGRCVVKDAAQWHLLEIPLSLVQTLQDIVINVQDALYLRTF